jgi:hypothetical protein
VMKTWPVLPEAKAAPPMEIRENTDKAVAAIIFEAMFMTFLLLESLQG